MRASRKRVKGTVRKDEDQLVISVLNPSSISSAFSSPLKFFIRKEFRRYKSVFSGQWWDGALWSRGETLSQKGLFKNIPPELRIETDYLVNEAGQIQANTEFSSSEYSEVKQRRCKSRSLPTQLLPQVQSLFTSYLCLWNNLVTMDKNGQSILVLPDQSQFEKKVVRDYQSNRKKSNGPLRFKNLHNLKSVPMDIEKLDIRPVIKEVIDLRYLVSGRIIKRSKKKYQVRFVHSETKVREVCLSNFTINSCRDPRLKDVGITFSKQGLSMVTQDAFDRRSYYIIKPETLISTHNFLNNFFNQINGKVRSIALDSSCAIPKNLVEFRKKFIKKCRTMKAEGAAAFYEAPKLIPLGEAYPDNLPAHNPKHLKVWKKKVVREMKDYALIQGLTGEHMLVIPSFKGPLTTDGGEIPGLVMANHTLLQAAAKWDMWPGATFLSRASCRTVRKG